MRTCRKCGEPKPLTEFSTYKWKNKIGHRWECCACTRRRNSSWVKQHVTPEQHKARRQRYVEKHGRAAEVARVLRYRSKNRERVRLYMAWYGQQPEVKDRVNAMRREAYTRNLPHSRNRNTVRRRRYAEGDLTLEQWEHIVDLYSGRCGYCGDDASTIEHVRPLSRGGQHTALNVIPACKYCNLRKGSKTVEEWMGTIGFGSEPIHLLETKS